jgi:hypothetical protein
MAGRQTFKMPGSKKQSEFSTGGWDIKAKIVKMTTIFGEGGW